ncbi:hypothetical protein BN1723_008656 [Verticillium longisporum]|uniref:Uncharacterized protein n=1 Tax=Verticillium longisporum TaxID=100787 RepID=A0A0G4KHM4_VERLO|nr:hypothetical protein BN1723_008656 [Verticillium longisporum]
MSLMLGAVGIHLPTDRRSGEWKTQVKERKSQVLPDELRRDKRRDREKPRRTHERRKCMLTSGLPRSFTAKEAWMQSCTATDVALDPVAPVSVHQGGGRYEEGRVGQQVSLQVGAHPAMNARQTGKEKATGDFWAA